jgi:hypothetical protein
MGKTFSNGLPEYREVTGEGITTDKDNNSFSKVFTLHTCEISFIICIIVFGVTGYSMRNNKKG